MEKEIEHVTKTNPREAILQEASAGVIFHTPGPFDNMEENSAEIETRSVSSKGVVKGEVRILGVVVGNLYTSKDGKSQFEELI